MIKAFTEEELQKKDKEELIHTVIVLFDALKCCEASRWNWPEDIMIEARITKYIREAEGLHNHQINFHESVFDNILDSIDEGRDNKE